MLIHLKVTQNKKKNIFYSSSEKNIIKKKHNQALVT